MEQRKWYIYIAGTGRKAIGEWQWIEVTFSPTGPTINASLVFGDMATNESGWFDDAILDGCVANLLYDKTPPSGTLQINRGLTTSTTSNTVLLNINATDNCQLDQMAISETEDFSNPAWEKYSSTRTWALSNGSGKKTIYIKLKDAAGNISDVITSDINYYYIKQLGDYSFTVPVDTDFTIIVPYEIEGQWFYGTETTPKVTAVKSTGYSTITGKFSSTGFKEADINGTTLTFYAVPKPTVANTPKVRFY